jgi:hypothetical protein
MLPKQIDPNKLKVKYVLGNHSSLPNYPTPEDILYELLRDYCARADENIRITDVHLAKRYAISVERAVETLEHLVAKGIAEIARVGSEKTTYEIILNPYA